MYETGWNKLFEDPITLPNGRKLVTLIDAGNYIASLPRKEHESDPWQAAIEALLMAAEDRRPLLHARVGMLRTLNRNVERVFNRDRKDPHWGKRKLKRGVSRSPSCRPLTNCKSFKTSLSLSGRRRKGYPTRSPH